MVFSIDIPDGSPELEELIFVVDKVNRERGARDLTTLTQYVQNIVLGYFTNRVLNEYSGFAKKQSLRKLENAFGKLKDIRRK